MISDKNRMRSKCRVVELDILYYHRAHTTPNTTPIMLEKVRGGLIASRHHQCSRVEDSIATVMKGKAILIHQPPTTCIQGHPRIDMVYIYYIHLIETI